MSKKVLKLDAATQTNPNDTVQYPWWRPPRPEPQRSLLKSKRGDRPGPGQRAAIDLEERPPVVNTRVVTNYKFAHELYGTAEAESVLCEGGCERRVRKSRGGLMPSTYTEFCKNPSTQMLGTFVCNSRAEAYGSKLLSLYRIRPELKELQMRKLLRR